MRTLGLLVLTAATTLADDRLGWNFQKGDTLVYVLENEYRFWARSRPGDARDPREAREVGGSGKYVEKMTLHFEILDVNGDGAAKIRITFPKIDAHARLDDTGEEARWNSESEKPPAEFGFGPYESLHKSKFEVTVQINGEPSSVKGPIDYLLPGRTKTRKSKDEMTREEKASEAMPMPLPVEFWVDTIFCPIPPDGRAAKFERRFTELLERRSHYPGEYDSDRAVDGLRCRRYRFEAKDRRIDEARAGRPEMMDFASGPRDGDSIKSKLAAAARDIAADFCPSQGLVLLVEGKARDDAFKDGAIARSQDWSAKLVRRIPAK